MTVTMTGKQGNQGDQTALTQTYINQTVYLGFATAVLSDTSTLSTITEFTNIARTNIHSNLGTPTIVNGAAVLSNSSDINTANCTVAGTAIKAWFITDAASGTSGNVLCYGNYDGTNALFTNVGQPITIPAGNLSISLN